MTPGILRHLRCFWAAEKHNVDHIMLWAACCTCFFGFLQSDEVTVPSLREYDSEWHLSEGDVTLDDPAAPSVVRVHIKSSKTDPFRKGVFVFLGRTDNDLCPVAAVAAYLVVRGRAAGPFFSFSSGGTSIQRVIGRRMREALHPSGVDVSKFAGHSFRIGAATTAASVGVEDSLIKTMGRWESSAYLLYVKVPRSRLADVSKRLASA